MNNLNSQQQAALIPINNINNGFNTVVTHELLEKQVNDIYLNTLSKGILSFNSLQLNALRSIATYCPQEGGVAVHQARGMLSMVENIDLLNFDCNPRSQKLKEEININATWEVILYPNPTEKELTIQSNIVLKNTTNVEIYNTLGQKVKMFSAKENSQTMQIDVSSLLDGVYTIRLKNGDNTVTKAFVVAK